MKKMLKITKTTVLFLLMAVVLVSLSGCGTAKDVVAEKTVTSVGITGKDEVTVKFNGSKPNKAIETITYESLSESQLNIVASTLEKTFAKKDVTVDMEVDAEKHTITYECNFADYVKVLGTSSKSADKLTRKDVVTLFENGGFTVK